MFTSKQRAVLRSMAQTIEPIGQIGKGGITDTVKETFSNALEARELIKITVLNNVDDDINYLAQELADEISAEVVCVIGHKIVLYRRSNKKGIAHVKF